MVPRTLPAFLSLYYPLIMQFLHDFVLQLIELLHISPFHELSTSLASSSILFIHYLYKIIMNRRKEAAALLPIIEGKIIVCIGTLINQSLSSFGQFNTLYKDLRKYSRQVI